MVFRNNNTGACTMRRGLFRFHTYCDDCSYISESFPTSQKFCSSKRRGVHLHHTNIQTVYTCRNPSTMRSRFDCKQCVTMTKNNLHNHFFILVYHCHNTPTSHPLHVQSLKSVQTTPIRVSILNNQTLMLHSDSTANINDRYATTALFMHT